jgi:hypothetical protein
VKSPPSVRLGRVALQILRYLKTYPNAQDTVEGIAEWWLLEERIRYMITEVKQALAELVARGMVLERTGRDGRAHYRLDSRKQQTVARLLSEPSTDSHYGALDSSARGTSGRR